MKTAKQETEVWAALDSFRIELPSWGFANTGTRFGKFFQPGAATSIEEKLSDAGQVQKYTGCCPSVALHVAWDLPAGFESAEIVLRKARSCGLKIGSINPTLFEEQKFKYGSLGNPDPGIRQAALDHVFESIRLARRLNSQDIVLWVADGSNYPGTANIRHRKKWFEDGLQKICEHLSVTERLLIEYKPFEPAFYHTDIADWGMAVLLARKAGPQAKVLVDTGHHYPSQNIEQIVAWLLSEDMLGGFHLNDRRYADDDLTAGSIDPYQLFRILCEIRSWAWECAQPVQVTYMLDQSHNLKNKIEAMIQTVLTAQELYAKAALVDYERLYQLQTECSLIDAEECLREPYRSDIRPLLTQWREARGLPQEPLAAFRESGYWDRVSSERAEKNRIPPSGYI